MLCRLATALTFCLFAGHAVAQCAPGIPGAGNPGCIPPSAPNSPYNQGEGNVAPVAPRPVGHWEDRWSAVALDLENLKNGLAAGQPDEASASSDAMDQCRANGGTQCKIFVAYHNQCAAIAQQTQTHRVSGATGADKAEALSRVQKKCGDESACQIIYNQCSLPVLVR